MQPIDFNELYLFAQVVDAGSFSATSRKLNIPKATISRRIANLEKRLGVALIRRNTHQFFITHIGQQYYQYCKAMIAEAQQAESVIAHLRGEPAGYVRLSCPKDILDYFINPILVKYLKQYPHITLQVEVNEHHVDVLQSGFDFVIRARREHNFDKDMVARRFGELRQLLVASPQLINRKIENLIVLREYDCLSDRLQGQWTFKHPHKRDWLFSYQAKIASKNLSLLRQFLCDGQGIGVMPYFSIQQEIKQGKLISLLPDPWYVDSVIIHAAYPSHKTLLPAAANLLDFLCEQFYKENNFLHS